MLLSPRYHGLNPNVELFWELANSHITYADVPPRLQHTKKDIRKSYRMADFSVLQSVCQIGFSKFSSVFYT